MIFSVIVPTHHRPQKLRELLNSLSQQSLAFDKFEVLLVPSPNDSGIKDLPSYPFSLQILPANDDPYKGTSASYKRNRGAQQAHAAWLAFIDDDCIAHPDWLKNAIPHTQTTQYHGIEGLTKIPPPPKVTYTYKGLQRLSRSGGYQTCNMFYNKATFLKCGGFDLHFPFYLEDTDIAWTLLDNNYSIVFEENCIVEHPVPKADVDRLLFNAFRARLIPYLYKKHPALFIKNNWRALQRFQWLFLFLQTALLVWFLSSPTFTRFIYFFTALFVLSFIYTAKQLWGCSFEWREALKMLQYYTITPWITFFQLWRGNLEQKTFVWR